MPHVSMPRVFLFFNVAPSNVNSDTYNSNLSNDVVTLRNVFDRIGDIRENVGDKHNYSKTNAYKSLLDFSTQTTADAHDGNTTQFFFLLTNQIYMILNIFLHLMLLTLMFRVPLSTIPVLLVTL